MERPTASGTPRCYVLDDAYRLILACPGDPSDPLNEYYDAKSEPDALPEPIESVVRSLTGRWEREGEQHHSSACVNGLVITVSPLHGPRGRHFAVFVESELAHFNRFRT